MKVLLMMFLGLVVYAGFTASPAHADFIPPPCVPFPACLAHPPPSPPDPADHSGNRWKTDVGKALVNGAVCTIGGIVIDRVADVKQPLPHKFGNALVCNGVALMIAGPPGFGGLFGLVATQTICCGSQSIVVKSLRPGGWKCQSGDRVDGCARWVSDHSPRIARHLKPRKRAKHLSRH